MRAGHPRCLGRLVFQPATLQLSTYSGDRPLLKVGIGILAKQLRLKYNDQHRDSNCYFSWDCFHAAPSYWDIQSMIPSHSVLSKAEAPIHTDDKAGPND